MNYTDKAIAAAVDAAKFERDSLREHIAESVRRIEFLSRIIGDDGEESAKDAQSRPDPQAEAVEPKRQPRPAPCIVGSAKRTTGAQEIARIRESRGWTVEETAAILGVSVASVERWIRKARADDVGRRDCGGREPAAATVQRAMSMLAVAEQVVSLKQPHGRRIGSIGVGSVSHDLLRFLCAVPSATWAQCGNAVLPKSLNSNHMYVLKNAGLITRVRTGRYQITDAGREKRREIDAKWADRNGAA